VPPDDPKSFGNALGHCLSHPHAWQHLRDEAPRYAQEWSDGAMAARLALLYRELAGLKIASESACTAAI